MGRCTEDGDEAEAQQQAKGNPEMTTAEIEATVALMKGRGIVDSGEAVTAGTGRAAPIRHSRYGHVRVGHTRPMTDISNPAQ